MSLRLKCHWDWNFTKTEMSLKLKCHWNWNVTKTEMPLKLKCHWNWNVTETEMSLKLQCQWIAMSLELKCRWNCNCTKTESSLKLKLHWNWNVTTNYWLDTLNRLNRRNRMNRPIGLNSQVPCFFFLFSSEYVVELVCGGSVINGAYPVSFFSSLVQVITASSHSKSCLVYNCLIPFKILFWYNRLSPYLSLVLVLHSWGQSGGAIWWRVCF